MERDLIAEIRWQLEDLPHGPLRIAHNTTSDPLNVVFIDATPDDLFAPAPRLRVEVNGAECWGKRRRFTMLIHRAPALLAEAANALQALRELTEDLVPRCAELIDYQDAISDRQDCGEPSTHYIKGQFGRSTMGYCARHAPNDAKALPKLT